MDPSKKSTLFTFLMVVSMVIWGGSWVSAKSIANTLPSETLTFWRFFVNFIALFPVLFLVKEPFKADRKALAYTLTGSLFMGGYLYLFFKGLKYGFAGAAGVLVTTTVPLLTFVLTAVFYRHKFSARDLIGLVFGILGGSILLGIWTLDLDKILVSGNLYFLLAALLWALLTICSQQAGNTISPIVFSFLANAFCTLIAFFVALPYGIMGAFEQGAHFWLNIFYLAAISSAFATTVYFFASSILSSRKASSFVFLVPFSAVILSWFFLGEVPRINTIAGGSLAIGAVYILNQR